VQLSHPRASNVICNYTYGDDPFSEADSAEGTQLIARELHSAFPLRKWTSNHIEILAHIQSDHLLNADFLEMNTEGAAKPLGVRWKAMSDEFFFVPPDLANKISPTKRKVLS